MVVLSIQVAYIIFKIGQGFKYSHEELLKICNGCVIFYVKLMQIVLNASGSGLTRRATMNGSNDRWKVVQGWGGKTWVFQSNLQPFTAHSTNGVEHDLPGTMLCTGCDYIEPLAVLYSDGDDSCRIRISVKISVKVSLK